MPLAKELVHAAGHILQRGVGGKPGCELGRAGLDEILGSPRPVSATRDVVLLWREFVRPGGSYSCKCTTGSSARLRTQPRRRTTSTCAPTPDGAWTDHVLGERALLYVCTNRDAEIDTWATCIAARPGMLAALPSLVDGPPGDRMARRLRHRRPPSIPTTAGGLERTVPSPDGCPRAGTSRSPTGAKAPGLKGSRSG